MTDKPTDADDWTWESIPVSDSDREFAELAALMQSRLPPWTRILLRNMECLNNQPTPS